MISREEIVSYTLIDVIKDINNGVKEGKDKYKTYHNGFASRDGFKLSPLCIIFEIYSG